MYTSGIAHITHMYSKFCPCVCVFIKKKKYTLHLAAHNVKYYDAISFVFEGHV